MIIDRRELIIGAAFVAVAPPLKPLPSQLTSFEAELGPVTFMIEGWSSQDDGGTTDFVWIRIGHAWRTTWQ
jgi:hypothetical protein